MAYTNKGNVQKFLNVDIASSFDAQITAWIVVAKAWIDRYCGKTFESASADRTYDGNGKRNIFIDDMSSVPTAVVILDIDGTVAFTLTEGASNDYLVYPLNESTKNELRLVNGATIGNFPARNSSLKVTAPFGFSVNVPADIEIVATKLVSDIVKEGLKGGKLSSVSLGDYEANFQKIDETADAMGIYQILDMYRDITL